MSGFIGRNARVFNSAGSGERFEMIGLTAGIPSYWLDAAMVRVKRDAESAQRLHGEVLTWWFRP